MDIEDRIDAKMPKTANPRVECWLIDASKKLGTYYSCDSKNMYRLVAEAFSTPSKAVAIWDRIGIYLNKEEKIKIDEYIACGDISAMQVDLASKFDKKFDAIG